MAEDQNKDPKAIALEGVASAGLALLQALLLARRAGVPDDEMMDALEALLPDFEELFSDE